MKKSVFVILLCALLIAPLTAAAATYTEGYFFYEVEDESITITGYFGRDSEVDVPSNIAGLPVSTIAGGAFSGNSSVGKVNLPDTIMTIENGAFSGKQSVVYNGDSGAASPEPTAPSVTFASSASAAYSPSAPARPNSPAGPADTPQPGVTADSPNVQQGAPLASAPANQVQEPSATPAPSFGSEAAGVQSSAKPGQNGGTEKVSAKTEPPGESAQQETQTGEEASAAAADRPEAGFEVSELLEDGTVVTVESATTMPTPTPAPPQEPERELIVQLDGTDSGPGLGLVLGLIGAGVLTVGAVVCLTVMWLRRRRR